MYRANEEKRKNEERETNIYLYVPYKTRQAIIILFHVAVILTPPTAVCWSSLSLR